MNPHYTNTNDLLPTTRARASDVESNFSAVEAGFDSVEMALQSLISLLALKASLASPTFTGAPTAPTPPSGDTSNRVATMAAIAQAISAAIAINLPTPSGNDKSLVFRSGVATWGDWFDTPINCTSSQTLVGRKIYLIDSTAGPFSLTLPTDDSWVFLVDVAGQLSVNNVTLIRGAREIMNVAEDCIMNTDYFSKLLIPTADKGWIFV